MVLAIKICPRICPNSAALVLNGPGYRELPLLHITWTETTAIFPVWWQQYDVSYNKAFLFFPCASPLGYFGSDNWCFNEVSWSVAFFYLALQYFPKDSTLGKLKLVFLKSQCLQLQSRTWIHCPLLRTPLESWRKAPTQSLFLSTKE